MTKSPSVAFLIALSHSEGDGSIDGWTDGSSTLQLMPWFFQLNDYVTLNCF